MEDFKSALLEMIKYKNKQQLKLQENQNEEQREEKQLEFQNLTLKLFAGKNPSENEVCFPQNTIWSAIDNSFLQSRRRNHVCFVL